MELILENKKITRSLPKQTKLKRWNLQEREYLERHYANTSNRVLAVYFGVSLHSIKGRAQSFGLKKSQEYMSNPEHKGWFQNGNIPYNKNTKGICKPTSGSFKKGYIPANKAEDAQIRIRKHEKYKYKFIKINDRWISYHKYLWEQKYGKVPKGYMLRFKTDNRLDSNPDNVECISLIESLNRNRNQEKAIASLKRTRDKERIRAKYGLERKTKLKI